MSKINVDLYLGHKIDRFITHYAQNWMADYDADEVGQYLVEECGESYTGDYQITITETDSWHDSTATRASFLKWRYNQKYPLERAGRMKK